MFLTKLTKVITIVGVAQSLVGSFLFFQQVEVQGQCSVCSSFPNQNSVRILAASMIQSVGPCSNNNPDSQRVRAVQYNTKLRNQSFNKDQHSVRVEYTINGNKFIDTSYGTLKATACNGGNFHDKWGNPTTILSQSYVASRPRNCTGTLSASVTITSKGRNGCSSNPLVNGDVITGTFCYRIPCSAISLCLSTCNGCVPSNINCNQACCR
jgi:hypothetical protein